MAMNRSYGAVQTFDIKANGATAVSLTPGAAVQSATFTMTAPKGGVNGKWPLCLDIVMKLVTDIDQPSSGGSAIHADQLPQIVDSFNVQSPWLGITHDRVTYTGPNAKNVIEFQSRGYESYDGARIVIPSTDGDNSVVYYQSLPFAHGAFDKPHHFAPWLGWLNQTEVTLYLAPNTAIGSVSTGAVTEAPCTVYCWADYVTSNELLIPTVNQWNLYTQPANGGNSMLLQGIGTKHGLDGVKDGSRINAMLELFNVLGLNGATTADNITSITIPAIGMDITVNIDSFFGAYRDAMGGHKGAVADSATVPVPDRGGHPYPQTSAVSGSLNDATAMFLPVRFPGLNQQLTKLLRIGGDVEVTQTYTSTPSSGTHRWLLNEMRELSEDKKKELVGRTGKKGAYTLERIFSTGTPDGRDTGRHKNTGFCLPQRVVWG